MDPPTSSTPSRTHNRTRTQSTTTVSMKPPPRSAAGTSPSRNTPTHSRAPSTASPSAGPKTAPRLKMRQSLVLGASERRQLATELEEVEKESGGNMYGFSSSVTYITPTLLTKLTGCNNLKEAKVLHISDSETKVKVIENMDLVENLEELDLSDNQISQIRNLQPLRKLKILNLSTNLIIMIEGFDTLARLEELDLSGNQIERIPTAIKVLVSLKTLKLHNNKLSTLRDLANLRQLKNLTSITIFQNPITDIEHSRLYAVFQLPGVSSIDDAIVDETERSDARTRFDREEIEVLESKVSALTQELKTAKEEAERLKKDTGNVKTNEKRLGKDVNSLMNRIEQLETESQAKTELLNKKSTELVGLCELLYAMKQELAFANIDSQFDMSAVDSIIGGSNLVSQPDEFTIATGPSASKTSHNITHTISPSSSENAIDAQLDRLDSDEFLSPNSGVLSPALLLVPTSGISEEFREMPYFGKTSTPIANRNSRPTSRVGNETSSRSISLSKFKPSAETQQAAYRYKTLLNQESALDNETSSMQQALDRERAQLGNLKSQIEAKKTFIHQNPESPDNFSNLLEIQQLEEELDRKSAVIRGLEAKLEELNTKINAIKTEQEEMKSLIQGLDQDFIDSSYDLSMEVKSLEAQIEDRDETIEKMRQILQKHGLANELNTTVLLKGVNTETNTHSHSPSINNSDWMEKLRELEEKHIQLVSGLIREFPRYPSETNYWETQSNSMDTACHTLKQMITDAFGTNISGEFLTMSCAELRKLIEDLRKKVEFLNELKVTNFFNTEDYGADIDVTELQSSSSDIQSTNDADNNNAFEARKQQDQSQLDTDSNEDEEAEEMDQEIVIGSGITKGIRREHLNEAYLKQLWLLWKILTSKMEQIRGAWQQGAVSSSNMVNMMDSGEWKYWTGMGRMEFFFRHAMAQVDLLEKMSEALKQSIVQTANNFATSISPSTNAGLNSERIQLVSEIETLSNELSMKQVDVHSLRAEIAELESRKLEMQSIKNELSGLTSQRAEVSSDITAKKNEIAELNERIAAARTRKSEVEELDGQHRILSIQLREAKQAQADLVQLKQDYAYYQLQVSTLQPAREEVERLRRERETLNEQIVALKSNQSTTQAAKPPSTPSRGNAVLKRTVTTSSATTPFSSHYQSLATPLIRQPKESNKSQTADAPPTKSPSSSSLSSSTNSALDVSSPISVPSVTSPTPPTTTTPSSTPQSNQQSASANNIHVSIVAEVTSPETMTPSSSNSSLSLDSQNINSSSSDLSKPSAMNYYRQKEEEARKRKEQMDVQKSTKPALMKSWTVKEPGKLAKASIDGTSGSSGLVRNPSTNRGSTSHARTPSADSPVNSSSSPLSSSPSTPTKEKPDRRDSIESGYATMDESPKSSSSDRATRRRSTFLPKALMEFHKEDD